MRAQHRRLAQDSGPCPRRLRRVAYEGHRRRRPATARVRPGSQRRRGERGSGRSALRVEQLAHSSLPEVAPIERGSRRRCRSARMRHEQRRRGGESGEARRPGAPHAPRLPARRGSTGDRRPAPLPRLNPKLFSNERAQAFLDFGMSGYRSGSAGLWVYIEIVPAAMPFQNTSLPDNFPDKSTALQRLTTRSFVLTAGELSIPESLSRRTAL